MRPIWLVVLAVTTALAGCADDGPSATQALPQADLNLDATASTGIIRGIVLDAAVRPLAAISVSLDDGTTATTGEDGAFGFQGLSPGVHFVTATGENYLSTRAGIHVEAGNDKPAWAYIFLEYDPTNVGYVQTYLQDSYVELSAAAFASFNIYSFSDANTSFIEIQLDQTPQFVQGELAWEANMETARYFRGQFRAGDDEGRAFIAHGAGESPVIIPHAWDGNLTTDSVTFSAWVTGPNGLPVGLATQQELQMVVSIFYGCVPPEGWSFVTSGEGTCA